MTPCEMIAIALIACAALSSSAFAVAPTDALPEPKPLRLSPGPHLFIDDHLVQETVRLVRRTHQPQKLPQPILGKAEPWHQQPLFFQKVIHDAAAGRFRMWYNVKNPGADPFVCYAYAESEDGIRWNRPNLGLVSVAGSTENNLIDAPLGHFSLFFVDDGPDFPDPSRRYKMGFYDAKGLFLAFSPDGFRFTPHPDNPVIPRDSGQVPDLSPGYVNIIGDIIDGCWDPLRKRYLLACKIEKDGYPGKPHYFYEGWRRCVGMSVSDDFIHWKTPWFIVTPDPANGIEEFYGFQPMIRGDFYIGFLRILRDDLPADPEGAVNGIGWTELITSRDGETWTRYQETFIDRNHDAGTWDHAMAWVGDCLTVGDKDYVYYCGYSAGHKVGDRQNGLAILRKNGFVSRDAGPDGATLRTPLVTLDADALTVNASVAGDLRIRILDETGTPLEGFDWDDVEPLHGDSVEHRVQWSAPLSSLRQRPVHLEFNMHEAQLYAFDLAEEQ